MKPTCSFFIIILFTILNNIQSTFAQTTYYFSISGNDVNNGLSPSTPKQTLSALQTLLNNASPGDSLLLKKGDTWTTRANTNWGLDISADGAPGNHVVIASYGSGENPKFSWAGTGTNNGEGTNDYFIRFYSGSTSIAASYVTIKDLQLVSTTSSFQVSWGIWVHGSSAPSPNNIILDNILIDKTKQGIGVKYNASNITIQNCTIQNTNGGDSTGSVKGGEAIYVGAHAINANIINNTFINNWNPDDVGHSHVLYLYIDGGSLIGNEMYNSYQGIAIVNPQDVDISDNIFHDITTTALTLHSRINLTGTMRYDNADSVNIMRNIFYDNWRAMDFNKSVTSTGDPGATTTRNINFYNNVIYNNSAYGIAIQNSGAGGQQLNFQNILIANNTIVNSASIANMWVASGNMTFSNVNIKNNILYNTTSSASGILLKVDNSTFLNTILFNYNLYDNTVGTTTRGGINRTLSQFQSAFPTQEQNAVS